MGGSLTDLPSRSHGPAEIPSVRFLGRFAGSVPVKTRIKQSNQSINRVASGGSDRFQNQLGPMTGIQRHQIEDVFRIDSLCPLPNPHFTFKRRRALCNQRTRDQMKSVFAGYGHSLCDGV